MVNRLLLLFVIFFSYLNASNWLKSAYIEQDRLTLEFSKSPKSKDVKYSFRKNSTIRYIFDFYNTKLKSKNLSQGLDYESPVKSIEISQHKKFVRVAIESTISYKPKVGKADKIYQIILPKQSKPLSQIGNKVKELFSSLGSSSSSNSLSTVSFSKKKYTIILDPGHGGSDPGAISPTSRRYREKNAVLQIALKVRKYLQRMGFKVLMTRSSDRFIKLPNRTHFANRNRGDVFVSIHANSIKGNRRKRARARGIETYYLSKTKSKKANMVAEKENSVGFDKRNYKESMKLFLNTLTRSKIVLSHKLAMDIQSKVVRNLKGKYRGVVNGGVKPAPFWVLVGAEMPAILIETGYLSNPTERKRLFNRHYQDRLAKGIAEGIARFLKNREKEME